MTPAFPITSLLPDIVASLAERPRLVLEAPPGAGKTTQVPLALLDAPWLAGQRIVMLEPRRIAARAAAGFMSRQLGEEVGGTVGYRIRFESRVGPRTRIEVVTEGILGRMIQDDPSLEGVGAIVFDEFHERHLAGDLGAALALDVQASLRPELRLVVMSATLDGERIAQWLDAPRLTSPGRSFPVHIVHPPARAQETVEQHLARTVQLALRENEGDVLAFLPGRREIERVRGMLERMDGATEVVALHGELSLAEQQLALTPADPGSRRVVLATNVAESSVTLPGIRAVVDSGQAREPRFDPASGFSRLDTVVISQASADQRAGRAGRVAEGRAYRLWAQSRRLEPSRTAEIEQAELSGLALELAGWGSESLPWLDAPPAGAMSQARDLLRRLGALDDASAITTLGREMLALGATPRLGAAAMRARSDQRALVADLLALTEARSPLRGEASRNDDFRQRVHALHLWRDGGTRGARIGAADAGALAAIDKAAAGWRRRIEARTPPSGVPNAHAVGDLLAHAFPDRVAKRDDAQPSRYQLANGRGARLHENSALLGEPWLVIIDLRLDARDSLIYAAAPLDPDVLEREHAERFTHWRVLRWDDARQIAEAFEERRFDALVVSRKPVPVSGDDAMPALLAAIRSRGIGGLPWTENARRLRTRIGALRTWRPELGLPDVGDEALSRTLEAWLGPFLAGKRRLEAIQPAELSDAIAAMLDYDQRRALDAHAPEEMVVPSGMARRLEYGARDDDPGAPPVLAVKLQELFGLADTPRVGDGRVPVMLHLLSPAGRPIQVTQDLSGFWNRTYPEVKKELKGRYPKHPWPDDPWTATATHRAKPRGT
ncbi:ATP-dependent helicase HrpB [Luteibacter pinisoli]|uniref:ATP-dependent helicase HrpB n=1 Tax=Luteibacter pinisoli TaxID=2589080 RepID=A0A4Y5Z0D3_9GAMM|nr:ATP-dependent helicase HrpB [Luteibacter pinisoli]QDE38099.1 ATP-dependent helicase HrpB [Luteibacter pinisoli]